MSRSLMHCCHRNFPIRNHISTITVMGKNSNTASFYYKTPTFKVPRILCVLIYSLLNMFVSHYGSKMHCKCDCYTETFKFVRETTTICTFFLFSGCLAVLKRDAVCLMIPPCRSLVYQILRSHLRVLTPCRPITPSLKQFTWKGSSLLVRSATSCITIKVKSTCKKLSSLIKFSF